MIIQIAADKTLSLDDAMNFKKFKVACAVPEARFADMAEAASTTVSFDDSKTAWVSIASLQAWEGLKDDKAWQEGLAAMIKAATPYGWISEEKQAIKAHVEWLVP